MSPGDRLGRYTLGRVLGRGSSGEVWEATLHGPDGFEQPLALKLLYGAPQRPQRIGEARVATQLHHPNVVSTTDIGEHEGRWYVAMELVRGASLAELLAQGPLPASAVLDVGIQACAGLGHVHALQLDGRPAGLVHRDVKLSNLLLDRTGLVKLADLGIVSLAEEVWGTPSYAAPELATGAPVDGRADLFSLGVVLYALATAQRPFGTGEEALRAVQNADALLVNGLLRPVAAAVPGLDEVLYPCLRTRPQDRWASAAELGAALGALRARQTPGTGLLELLERHPHGTGWTPTGAAPRPVRPGNLPASRGVFLGRDPELAQLLSLLRSETGLVTLLGMGGSGKTRLALEVARALEPELDSAWFFDLVEARSPDEMCFAVARGLGLRLVGADPVGQIGHALRGRGRALVVLDNLEQLVEHSEVVERWVKMAPEARFLCTSRVALRLLGDRRFPLGSLSVADGVELFLARAPVPIESEERASVAAIVEVVEGLPLAIELAAARTRLMRVPELLRRLKNALRMLAGGERDVPVRHRSLRASLLGSWELLSTPARAALAQLSVFEGGATLASASAVLGEHGGQALDVLQELGDASLVRFDPAQGRFGTLLVVQAFAAEQLTPEARERAERRHAAYHAQLGTDEALAALSTQGGVERTRALMAEADNLLAALRRSVERGEAEAAVGSLRAAWRILEMRGPVQVGAAWADRVLAMPLGELERGKAGQVAGEAYRLAGRGEQARLRFEQALAAHRAAGDRRGEAEGVFQLGQLCRERGEMDEARRGYQSALQSFRALGDPRSEGIVLGHLGVIDRDQGRFGDARERYGAALALHRRVGNRRDEGHILGSLGNVLLDQGLLSEALASYHAGLVALREVGDRRSEAALLGSLGVLYVQLGRMDDARTQLEAVVAIHREVGDRRGEGIACGNLGQSWFEQGHFAEARQHFERALRIHREVGNRRSEGITLGNLGLVCAEDPQTLDEAAPLYEAAIAIHRVVGNPRSEGVLLSALGNWHVLRDQPDEARSCYHAAADLLRSIGSARAEGMALRELGVLEARCGQPLRAAEALARSEALLRKVGDPVQLARQLAAQAEAAWLAGQREAAHAALDEMEALGVESDRRMMVLALMAG
jgi:predicted ATPase/Tfp pilus assembly protein PilF